MDILAFIARYEAILKDRRISKAEFYKACKITDAAVSQWRKGKTKPATTTIERIAKYLDVTPEYLLTGTETDQKEKPVSLSGNELSPIMQTIADELDGADDDLMREVLEFVRFKNRKIK